MDKGLIDRRVARTRAALHRALLSLIATKGYEAVTVGDICKRANVGRSTFYDHYTNKDNLMRGGLGNLRGMLLKKNSRTPPSKNAGNRGLAFSLPMLEHARAHAHLHRMLLGNRGGAIALDTIRNILSEAVRSELVASSGRGSTDGVPRELIVQYLVGAYMAVVSWWLDRGAKLAPERIDAMFQSLAADGIAGALRPIHSARSKC